MSDNDWLKLVEKFPSHVRQEVARARNTQARVTGYRMQMVEEGVKLKRQVRRLNTVHNLNPHLLGKLLGITRTRVLEILGQK